MPSIGKINGISTRPFCGRKYMLWLPSRSPSFKPFLSWLNIWISISSHFCSLCCSLNRICYGCQSELKDPHVSLEPWNDSVTIGKLALIMGYFYSRRLINATSVVKSFVWIVMSLCMKACIHVLAVHPQGNHCAKPHLFVS